ncbi:MAG: hypothetical protein OXH09_21000 [Gammaproteobacteria bacterium]|nr:hypothetical protein [Gammaproteobacteria bacterium]
MAVSERDRSYFRRIGEWRASLPPHSDFRDRLLKLEARQPGRRNAKRR